MLRDVDGPWESLKKWKFIPCTCHHCLHDRWEEIDLDGIQIIPITLELSLRFFKTQLELAQINPSSIFKASECKDLDFIGTSSKNKGSRNVHKPSSSCQSLPYFLTAVPTFPTVGRQWIFVGYPWNLQRMNCMCSTNQVTHRDPTLWTVDR